MKINVVKLCIIFGISVLLGLLCYEIAKAEDSRNWISLATTGLSVFICLTSAVACDYNCGHRSANMKVCAWVISFLVIATNFIFSAFEYTVVVYVVIISLLVLIDALLLYAMYKPL